MGDRKGVHPVVVGGVPVALLHHQTEPGGRGEGSRGASGSPPPARPSGSAWPGPFLYSWSQGLGLASHSGIFPTPADRATPSHLQRPLPRARGNGCESAGQREAKPGAACTWRGGLGRAPGQSRAVDLVVVDEIHVLQHAQNGLERAEGRDQRDCQF